MACYSFEVKEHPGRQLWGVGEQADKSKCEDLGRLDTGRNRVGKEPHLRWPGAIFQRLKVTVESTNFEPEVSGWISL